MKYIRTKDGRIIKFDTSDVEEEIAGIKYDILGFRLKTTMQFYNLQKEDVVRIADTIEELCDKLVCFMCGDNEPYICSIYEARYLRELEQYGGKIVSNLVRDKVYGAIWTDKGLIYVAKMNEKGELELL